MDSCDESLGADEESVLSTDGELLSQDGIERATKRAEDLFDEREYSAAAGEISKVLAVLSEKYGEGKPECADALYFYGKALYFHVIETAGMLGRSAVKYGLDSSIIDGEETVHHAVNSKTRDDREGGDDASSVDEDLDLAYQVLSLAVNAYGSGKVPGSEKKIGDASLYLGHVHLECERPSEAADCFKNALEHKSKYLPDGHRELSELLYMCGVALQALGKYTEALEYTKKARKNMYDKLEELKKKQGFEEQISHIEEELMDVDSKIEDLNYTIELASRAEYEKILKIPRLSGTRDNRKSAPKEASESPGVPGEQGEDISKRKRPHESIDNPGSES